MPKSTTPKLNDTQLIILSSASQREDGLAVLPESLKASAAKAAVTKLLGLGFLKEVRVKRDQPIWRNDEEDKPVGLKITKAGSAAIGVADEGAAEDEPAAEPKGRRKPKQHAPKRSRPLASLAPDRSRRRSLPSCGARTEHRSTTWSRRPNGCRTPRARRSRACEKKGYAIEKGRSPKGKTMYRIPAEDRSAPAGQQIA